MYECGGCARTLGDARVGYALGAFEAAVWDNFDFEAPIFGFVVLVKRYVEVRERLVFQSYDVYFYAEICTKTFRQRQEAFL